MRKKGLLVRSHAARATLALVYCVAGIQLRIHADDLEDFNNQIKEYLAFVASTDGVNQGDPQTRKLYEEKFAAMSVTASRIQAEARKKGAKDVNVKKVVEEIRSAYGNALRKVGFGRRTFTSGFTDDMTIALWSYKEQLDWIRKSGIFKSAAGIPFDLKAPAFPDTSSKKAPVKTAQEQQAKP